MKIILVSLFVSVSTASAAINMQTSYVGDAGNSGYPGAGSEIQNGSVGYNYYIGTYEVTNGQYAAFLNATAASDAHGLYNTEMAGGFGGILRGGSDGSYTYTASRPDNPVNYVSFWDAARFTNWLTSGDTETGVYMLGGVTNPTDPIHRDATAWSNGGVAVTSMNEWIKAGFYDGNGDYYNYPTGSDNTPGPSDANFGNPGGNTTVVGSFPDGVTHYGTYDQAGNVAEWTDNHLLGNFDQPLRDIRGAGFMNDTAFLELTIWASTPESPTAENSRNGFRISSLQPVPEPSAYAAIAGLLALGCALMRRRVGCDS